MSNKTYKIHPSFGKVLKAKLQSFSEHCLKHKTPTHKELSQLVHGTFFYNPELDKVQYKLQESKMELYNSENNTSIDLFINSFKKSITDYVKKNNIDESRIKHIGIDQHWDETTLLIEHYGYESKEDYKSRTIDQQRRKELYELMPLIGDIFQEEYKAEIHKKALVLKEENESKLKQLLLEQENLQKQIDKLSGKQ